METYWLYKYFSEKYQDESDILFDLKQNLFLLSVAIQGNALFADISYPKNSYLRIFCVTFCKSVRKGEMGKKKGTSGSRQNGRVKEKRGKKGRICFKRWLRK